jgi:flagellar biosynthesis/type III secretory pathway M-ring protein FliF/YscJ
MLKRRREEEIEVLNIENETAERDASSADIDKVSEAALAKIRKLTPAEKVRNAEQEAIEALSKAKPEEVAMLLKTWLAED